MLSHCLQFLLAVLPPTRLFALRRMILRLMGVTVGRGASVCGGGWIYGRGTLVIGDGSWLSPGARIYTHQDAAITIGANCDIGHDVTFVPGSHHVGLPSRRAGEGFARPITIADGCWIGTRTTILGGVSIGAGTIVAAGAVVTTDLPANVLAAGVPARVKKALPDVTLA